MSGSVLEHFHRGRGGQEAAEYDCTRYADALAVPIEVSDAVLTQRDEWNAAEVGERGVLEHHLGQLLGTITSDVVLANTVQQDMQGGKLAKHKHCQWALTWGADAGL